VDIFLIFLEINSSPFKKFALFHMILHAISREPPQIIAFSD
jgi:hypothetical protein